MRRGSPGRGHRPPNPCRRPCSCVALDGLARVAPPPAPPPETIRRTVTLTSRAAIIREALLGAPVVVLQDLLRGVRDRVVVAVTFLALLELMKRREIVVEQAEPWGPITARRMTAAERAAAGPGASTRTRRSTNRWSRSRDRGGRRDRGRRRTEALEVDAAAPAVAVLDTADAADASAPPAGELTEAQLEALLFVAEKPLSRREIGLLAGVDRATVDERLGDLEVALAGRGIRLILSGEHVELTTAPDAGALIARYVGADAVRLSPAALETLAIVAYRQPVTRAAIERIRGVDSDYTVRALLHRRLIVEQGRSDAPGRPFLYGTGFEFLERFGLTSLEELPALDLDVATRLVDEAGVAAGEPDAPDAANGAQPGAVEPTTADDGPS